MHWDRLFEDLEGQLASEWEAERAALDAESERLRIARLDMRARLRMLCAAGAEVTVDLADARRVPVTLRSLGADWIAATSRVATGSAPAATLLIPHDAITGIALDHGLLLDSLDERPGHDLALRERMTLGFVLRDLARRRAAVRLSLRIGDDLHGTIDRAAADHLDLALHDAGDARRAASVHGFRVIPFSALVAVRTLGDHLV
ncbi:hypothetical protein [Microbacterium sp. 179-I 3D3 NHS]|uniref:hypothetical protein n=1 Tax=Microbacterium sp. 179-I 3D3 NHS TaxID=3142382 RepID=UPI0039A12255